MTSSTEPHQGVAAVERALKILLVFMPGDPALSLAEIALRTSLYKSTILRLTTTLCKYGFLIRLRNGTYRLGSALLHLGELYKDSFHLEEVIIPALTDLMRSTGETATFWIRQENVRVCCFAVNSPESLREHLLLGDSRSIDESSTGQVFTLMEKKGAPREAPFPIYTEGVYDAWTASLAAPLVTSSGLFLGVLSVSGLTARFTVEKRTAAGDKLMETAAKLGIQLRGLSSITDANSPWNDYQPGE